MLALALLLTLAPVAAPVPPAVAVFDVELRGSTTLTRSDADQLTTYLATLLAQGERFKVIPRGQLKGAIAAQKSESYKACVDEACQIEVGRELAAEKSLLTQIGRLGKRCVITSTLFDLRTAASEVAATRTTECKVDVILEALGDVARELRGPEVKRPTPEPTPAGPARPELSVEGRPTDAAIWLGLTPLGRAPLRTTVLEGSYELTAQANGRITARTVVVGKEGATATLDVEHAETPAAGRCTPSAWATRPAGRAEGTARFFAAGLAEGHPSSLVLDTAARMHALVEVARSVEAMTSGLTRQYTETTGPAKDAPSASELLDVTIRGARVTEAEVCGDGTHFAEVEVAPEVPVGTVQGSGAGNVAAYGATGDAVEASAAAAALADALVWRALSTGDAKVKALERSYVSAVDDKLDEQHTRAINISALETMTGPGGAIEVRLTYRDLLESHTVDTHVDERQEVSAALQLTLRPKGGAELTLKLVDGVLVDAPDPIASERALRDLVKALELEVTTKKLPRVRGAPLTRAELRPRAK